MMTLFGDSGTRASCHVALEGENGRKNGQEKTNRQGEIGREYKWSERAEATSEMGEGERQLENRIRVS